MSELKPQFLAYATPVPVSRFAQMNIAVLVLLAMVVPGLSSSLVRGSPGRCLSLALIIPAAFVFFGPVWHDLLFRSPQWKELGLYPFIATCVLVELFSVVLVLSDRRRALRSLDSAT